MPSRIYHKTEEYREKMRQIALKGNYKPLVRTGKDSYSWKGDRVGYSALHTWVKNKLGKPYLCVICKTTNANRFEWANISHTYKRDVSDWIRLCKSCHLKYDKGNFCKWGHKYTEENTVYNKYGWRICRTCRKINNDRRYN